MSEKAPRTLPGIVGGGFAGAVILPRTTLFALHEVVAAYEHPDVTGLRGVERVLDVGANAGQFTLWAAAWWPGADFDCYEAHPYLARLCKRNVAGAARARVHTRAVVANGASSRWVTFYEGKRTSLGGSTLDVGWQKTADPMVVRPMHARELPACDVLKVDTEGNEVDIVHGYRHTPRMLLAETTDAAFEFLDGLARRRWSFRLAHRLRSRGSSVGVWL